MCPVAQPARDGSKALEVDRPMLRSGRYRVALVTDTPPAALLQQEVEVPETGVLDLDATHLTVTHVRLDLPQSGGIVCYMASGSGLAGAEDMGMGTAALLTRVTSGSLICVTRGPDRLLFFGGGLVPAAVTASGRVERVSLAPWDGRELPGHAEWRVVAFQPPFGERRAAHLYSRAGGRFERAVMAVNDLDGGDRMCLLPAACTCTKDGELAAFEWDGSSSWYLRRR